jgi:hypothetical protein
LALLQQVKQRILSIFNAASQAPVLWGYKDPSTDLRYVIPIRLYGDGADAQSLLVIYVNLCAKNGRITVFNGRFTV